MRSHGRHHKRGRGNKEPDNERYLSAQTDDMRPETYARLSESSRHSEGYRVSSSSNRYSYEAASTSRGHPELWRGDLEEEERSSYVMGDGYHRHASGREDHEVFDTRDGEAWSGRDVRYLDSPIEYQPYDYSVYPAPSYSESSSRNPPVLPHEHRTSQLSHWAEDARIDNRHMITGTDIRRSPNWSVERHRDKGGQQFRSDSGWDTRRRHKAWETRNATWDDVPHDSEHLIAERSWDAAPGWQRSNRGNYDQKNRNGQRNSAPSRNPMSYPNVTSKGSKRGSYKPKRDWRHDDNSLNNWQRREVYPSSEKKTKPPPQKNHKRSLSRSRSHSPAGSYYSHSSPRDRDRSMSRSLSPVPKRRRRGGTPAPPEHSPNDRERTNASPQYEKQEYPSLSPESMKIISPGYHSPSRRGRTGRTSFSHHSNHERHTSPASPSSPSIYVADRGRAILRPNAKYAKKTSPSRKSPIGSNQRRRSISTTPDASSGRSTSRSPPGRARAIHRLPPVDADAALSPVLPLRTASRRSAHQRNGKSQANGKHFNMNRRKISLDMDSMPPPISVPPHIQSHYPVAFEEDQPSASANRPSNPNAFDVQSTFPEPESDQITPLSRSTTVRNAGFKPISQPSSLLKKFFPGDEEVDPSTEQARSIPSSGVTVAGEGKYWKPRQPQHINRILHHERKTWPPPPLPLSPHKTAESGIHQHIEIGPSSVALSKIESSPTRPSSQKASSPTETLRGATSAGGLPLPLLESRSELYSIISQVGEGTFGKVYKAQHTITGTYVALKRIRMESEKDGFPVTAMREIKLLQSLQHRNVVRLYEMVVSTGSVYMVFEYMDHDLTGILSQTQFSFTEAHLKSLCHQMLAGLAYLHHKGVIHRDIKGSNILVNNQGELKLADFGLARFYQKRRRTDYTNRVITLWYRPPELLLGATIYGAEVDMWSAGCIMLELFTKKPVFQGNDEIHQLDVVYKIFGTPTPERWPGIMNLPWYELARPKETIPNRFRELFQKWMSPAALDLAEQLLTYNPEQRATAIQAMEAPYFTREEPLAALPSGLATLEGEWHELETKRERAKRKKKHDEALTEHHL